MDDEFKPIDETEGMSSSFSNDASNLVKGTSDGLKGLKDYSDKKKAEKEETDLKEKVKTEAPSGTNADLASNPINNDLGLPQGDMNIPGKTGGATLPSDNPLTRSKDDSLISNNSSNMGAFNSEETPSSSSPGLGKKDGLDESKGLGDKNSLGKNKDDLINKKDAGDAAKSINKSADAGKTAGNAAKAGSAGAKAAGAKAAEAAATKTAASAFLAQYRMQIVLAGIALFIILGFVLTSIATGHKYNLGTGIFLAADPDDLYKDTYDKTMVELSKSLEAQNNCGGWFEGVLDWFHELTEEGFRDTCHAIRYIKRVSEEKEKVFFKGVQTIDRGLVISAILYGYATQPIEEFYEEPEDRVDSENPSKLLQDLINQGVLIREDVDDLINSQIFEEVYPYFKWELNPSTNQYECVQYDVINFYHNQDKFLIFMRYGYNGDGDTDDHDSAGFMSIDGMKIVPNNKTSPDPASATGEGFVYDKNMLSAWSKTDLKCKGESFFTSRGITSTPPFDYDGYMSSANPYVGAQDPIVTIACLKSDGPSSCTLHYKDGFMYQRFPGFKRSDEVNFGGIYVYSQLLTPKQLERTLEIILGSSKLMNAMLGFEKGSSSGTGGSSPGGSDGPDEDPENPDIGPGEDPKDINSDSCSDYTTAYDEAFSNKVVQLAKEAVSAGKSIGDCSTFVKNIYRKAGYSLSGASYHMGKNLAGEGKCVNSLRPGDLVFYECAPLSKCPSDTGSRFLHIRHVAIYIGNGKIIDTTIERNTPKERSIDAVGTKYPKVMYARPYP